MIRQTLLLSALFSGAAFPGHALEIPHSASQDSRVRFVNYQPFNITGIVGSLRSSVQVEFAADEEIAHVALGNSVAGSCTSRQYFVSKAARKTAGHQYFRSNDQT